MPETKDLESLKAEAESTLAVLVRTLQVDVFRSLLPDAQEATLEEVNSLLFVAYVPFTSKRQLLDFLKDLEMTPSIGEDNVNQIKQILEEWNIPRF